MTHQIAPSIVRIFIAEDDNITQIAGTGFLVSKTDRFVLTCAHVVAAALGISQETQDVSAGKVYLDFPLVEPGKPVTATVVFWKPVRDVSFSQPDIGEDIAVLQLDVSPPKDSQTTDILLEDLIWGNSFQAFGFPKSQAHGISVSGILRGKQAQGWVQLEDVKDTGYFIEPGFSGSPVWDEQVEGIIGIVVASIKPLGRKTAFMLPTSTLLQAWPQLQEYLTDDLKSYLEKVGNSFLQSFVSYYPKDLSLDHIHQNISVYQSHLRTQRDEQPTQKTEIKAMLRTQDDESYKRSFERVYKWRDDELYLETREDKPYHKLENEELLVLVWDEIRRRTHRAVVLGDPGFGKSWLLRYERRQVAREQLVLLESGQRDKIIIPIYIPLSILADEIAKDNLDIDTSIVNILRREYQLHQQFLDYLRRLLRARDFPRCMLLFDALDEVVEANRPKLVEALRQFAESSCCRILLTSRIVGYQPPFVLHLEDQEECERELELVGFNKEQVNKFVECWFAKDKEPGKRLLDMLSREIGMRYLACIPLLLSFLCLASSGTGNVPGSRTALYEEVLRRLLRGTWRDQLLQEGDESRLEKKIELLESIAWHFATSHGAWRDIMSVSELSQVIHNSPLENQLLKTANHHYFLLWELSERDGILVKEAENTVGLDQSQIPYLFLHRTLHEYLVARYLAHQPVKVWSKIIKSHWWFDKDWVVVIVLLSGCLIDPNPLLKKLLNEPVDVFHVLHLLAGQCLAEADMGIVKQELSEPIIRSLFNLLHSDSGRDRERASHVISQIGEPAIVGSLTALRDADGNVRRAAAEYWGVSAIREWYQNF